MKSLPLGLALALFLIFLSPDGRCESGGGSAKDNEGDGAVGSDHVVVYAGGALVKNGGIRLEKSARSLGDLVRAAGGLTLFGNPEFFLFQRGGKTVKLRARYMDALLEEGDFIFAPEIIVETE